jgi:hypothetical protein
VALVPAGIVAAVLLPFAVAQAGRSENHRWITDWDLALRLRELRSSALTGPGVAGGVLLAIAAVSALVLLGAMVVAGRDRRARPLLVVAGIGLGAVGIGWAIAAVAVDGFLSRYFIGAVVTLIVASAAAALTRRTAPVAMVAVAVLAVVGVAGVVTVQRDPHAQRDDWRAVASAFEDRSDATSAALVIDRLPTIASPITRYLPDRRVMAAGERTVVTEIDVLTLGDDDRDCDWLVGRPCGFLFVGSPLRGELAETFVG